MKVGDLPQHLLDYWVAKAEGLDCGIESFATQPRKGCAVWVLRDGGFDFYAGPYSPSSNWSQGGPIIEEKRIELWDQSLRSGVWLAWAKDERGSAVHMEAETLLVAAMRAYVVSKFGEEVPDAG